MSHIFLTFVNMSISASYIVGTVLLLRLLLKKAPKWISVLLWGIVAIRLICPISFESVLSLIPSKETVSPTIMVEQYPTINTGIPTVNNTLNPIIQESFAPVPENSVNPLQVLIPILATIWVVGIIALAAYTLISYLLIKRKISTAVLLKDNIYQSENVVSPFVLGIFKPRIYLSFQVDHANMEHVIAHECAHIRRKDHLWKPLGFLLLTLHWFNPLVWIGYLLLCRDIELACDEKVIRTLDRDARAEYSQALLACSVNRRMISACPIAFGEVGVKARVKSVLNYKKPAFWIIIIALITCALVSVCFLTDPKRSTSDENNLNPPNTSQSVPSTPTSEANPDQPSPSDPALVERFPNYFGIDTSNGLDVYVWQMTGKSYSFGLLPHSDTQRHWISKELLSLKSATASEMRAILSTYGISEDKISIVPWQNPVSSYIGKPWIVGKGEDVETEMKKYIEGIREMLFGENTQEIIFPPKITLVYSNPVFSYVTNTVPNVVIHGGWLYDLNTDTTLGTVEEISLADTNFVELMGAFGTHYREQGEAILQTNRFAYKVYPTDPSTSPVIVLHYVLIQENGSTLLVYTHATPQENPEIIRWIFCISP